MSYNRAKQIIMSYRKDLKVGDFVPIPFINIKHNEYFKELNLRNIVDEMLSEGILVKSDMTSYILTENFFKIS